MPESFSAGFQDWVARNEGDGNHRYKYLSLPEVPAHGTALALGAMVFLDRREAAAPDLSPMATADAVAALLHQNFAREVHSGTVLATTEAICDPTAAELLVSRGGDDTTRTEAFDVIRGPAWPDGYDGRAIRNDTTDRWDQEPLGPAERLRLAEAYRHASAEDYAVRAMWAGDALDLIHEIESAADVIAAVTDDARRLLASAPTTFAVETSP